MNRLLAIDPGSRYIGFALFEKRNLVHYGVRQIRVRQSQEIQREGKAIIARLIQDFRPGRLVVEKTYFADCAQSAALNGLTKGIGTIAVRRGIVVRRLAANTVRKMICGNGLATKDDVARLCVARYPELKPYLTSDRKWKERYHRNMFDAVGLGIALLRCAR